jgi:tetratricopeptide (TPR) repeat protein
MTEEKPEEEKSVEVETPEPTGSGETTTADQDSKSDSPDTEASTEEAAETAETDDTSSTGSEDSDADFSPNEDPVEIIIKATANKEEGNGHFKNGDLDKAVRAYRKGTNQLKPLNKNNTGDEQVKALLVTLQNNLSMVFFKQNKMKVSRDVATKSLKIEPKNVKALYRRSMAHRKMGDLEKARDDLKEALKYEPNNAAVRKEFLAVKKELVTFKEKQKKALAGAFSSGSSLYEDKEEEKRKKEEEKKKKKEEEQKKKEQRKQMWEDECVKRMAKNEPAITYEDWEKEQEEAEKKKKKEEEDRRKAERKARAAARKAAKAESESDDDEELTPSELAMMRGYKKTADGRVTSCK